MVAPPMARRAAADADDDGDHAAGGELSEGRAAQGFIEVGQQPRGVGNWA